MQSAGAPGRRDRLFTANQMVAGKHGVLSFGAPAIRFSRRDSRQIPAERGIFRYEGASLAPSKPLRRPVRHRLRFPVEHRVAAASSTPRPAAVALGVAPMAAYRHVTGKDELLELMVDHVYGELEPPTAETGRRQATRVLAGCRGPTDADRRPISRSCWKARWSHPAATGSTSSPPWRSTARSPPTSGAPSTRRSGRTGPADGLADEHRPVPDV